jgi:hypothetical protein
MRTSETADSSAGPDFVFALYQGTTSVVPLSSSKVWDLAVKFQDVVVHSIENCEAVVARQKRSQEIEWTITIMLD